jgi:molybdopterin-guanine dinucleotide biosynthesis protein A
LVTQRDSPAPAVGVVVLAGGASTRLPGKLELDAGGLPLVARVVRNAGTGRETVVSVSAASAARIGALVDAPLAVDRWAACGPLGGLVSALAVLQSPLVFAVAGDAPFVGTAVIDALTADWKRGDEAVVPVHGEGPAARREPLAALYDRAALLAAGERALREGRYAMHAVLARLRTRLVPFADGGVFANVNTAADYASAASSFASASGKFDRP